MNTAALPGEVVRGVEQEVAEEPRSPLILPDDDLSEAVVTIADEMDSMRSWRERIRDTVWTVRFFLALLWHRRGA